MLRLSYLFSAGGKQREGIPFTGERQTENCLASDSQNARQHPRWDASSRHTYFSPAHWYPRHSQEKLAAAADLPLLMKAA